MLRLFLLFILFIGISSGITYVIFKFTKKKFIKYIPIIIPIYFCITSIYKMTKSTEGFTDVANFLLFLLFLSSVISIIFTGIILDKQKSIKILT